MVVRGGRPEIDDGDRGLTKLMEQLWKNPRLPGPELRPGLHNKGRSLALEMGQVLNGNVVRAM